ncbi:unnamed protein product [Phaeothamnion confervicola]
MTLSVAQADAMLQKLSNSLERWTPQQVVVCGGGNGAHVSAGFLASRGIRVNVFTRQPKRWGESIKITTTGSSWEHRGTLVGGLNTVSADPAQVVPGSDVILVAAPANAHPHILRAVAPFVDQGAAVGALFAQGGFDWAASHAFGEELFANIGCLFGLQNIPWICKIKKYGHEARIIGPKKCLYVATYPVEQRDDRARQMEAMFDIPCKTLPNFLNLTLTPSNQIIHPARYYSIFRDWDGKKTYSMAQLEERQGTFLYDNFDEFSAETLQALDNELQQVKIALQQRCPQLDLSFVPPIGERIMMQYGEDVTETSSLKRIFCSNLGYKGCATPLKEVRPGEYQPATESRLFWEDIPFGLCILKNLAEMLGNFPTPAINSMILWHQQFMGREFLAADGQLNPLMLGETGAPYKYGIHTLDDLVRTCLPHGLRSYRHPRARI